LYFYIYSIGDDRLLTLCTGRCPVVANVNTTIVIGLHLLNKKYGQIDFKLN